MTSQLNAKATSCEENFKFAKKLSEMDQFRFLEDEYFGDLFFTRDKYVVVWGGIA